VSGSFGAVGESGDCGLASGALPDAAPLLMKTMVPVMNTPAGFMSIVLPPTGAPTVMLGDMPTLDNTSTLMCMWAGVITFVTPGEFPVMVP
jgi:hypothetical protein